MTLWPLGIKQKNGLLVALAVLGAIPYGVRAVWSTALGGGIQIVNLWAMERGVAALLGSSDQPPEPFARVLVGVRTVGLLACVGLILWLMPIRTLAFVVGLSALVPAVLWHGLETARLPREGLE